MHQTGIIALFRSPPHSAVTSSPPLTGVAERALAGEVPVGGVGAAEGAVVTPVGQAGVELDAAVDARVARLTLAAVAAEPVETDAVQTRPRRAVILVTLTVTACTQGRGVFRGEGEGARRGTRRGRGGGPSRSRQTPCRHGRGAQSSSLLSQLRPAHRGWGVFRGEGEGRGGG